MKRIKADKTQRYADPAGPGLPLIEIVAGVEYDLVDEVADSIIENGDGHLVEVESKEQKIVVPESKDSGLGSDTETKAKPRKKRATKK